MHCRKAYVNSCAACAEYPLCVRCLLSFSPAHTQTLVGILPLLTHRTIEEHALNLATYGHGLQCQDSVYALQVEYEGDCTWKVLYKCKSICSK